MFNTLSLFNASKITTVLLLLVVLLLVFPGQAAGIGHEARLQEVSGLNAEPAISSERVESPDMFLARLAIEQADTAAPTAVSPEVTGSSYLALILILAASVILTIALLSWDRLFKQSEADFERVTRRCTLISESC